MTLDEFLTKLGKTPRWWRVVHEGQPSAGLRCDGSLGMLCPITAVAALEDDAVGWDLCQWEEAAEDLGLSGDLAHRIATAADRDDFTYASDARLRRRMLVACGLEQP